MIVRPRPNILTLFFVMRGSIVPRILPQIVGFAIYAAAVVAPVRWRGLDMASFNLTPFGLIGVTLSICLGLRNSAAYDRWWEGRKLWGQLVFEIRNLARAVIALIDDGGRNSAILSTVIMSHGKPQRFGGISTSSGCLKSATAKIQQIDGGYRRKSGFRKDC